MKAKGTVFGIVLLLTHCYNYGLLDKMKDPASTDSAEALMAFVSSFPSQGDMSSYNTGIFASANCGSFTSQGRADCACQAMATSAMLPMPKSGKYIAWLSTSSNDMSCRIQGGIGANCTIGSKKPTWSNTSGQIIAQGYSGILGSVGLLAPLNFNEFKTSVTNSTQVWTGTTPNGTYDSNQANCLSVTSWNSNTGSAIIGSVGSTNASWVNTGSGGGSCATGTAVIYCFGQPSP